MYSRYSQLSFIQFGLLMLIATPILRVAFCAVAFAKQGDRLYLLMKGDRFVSLTV